MFERFTERARQVVVLAQDEARAFRHDYIGTEHLLLGLLREDEGLAARVLESLGLDLVEVRAQVATIVGQGDVVASGQIPFTPRAKKVLELSLREALSLGHNYIGTEHILLGLIRENNGVAARILLDFDADAEKIRDEIIRMLSGPGRRPPEELTPGTRGGWSMKLPRQWRYRLEPAPPTASELPPLLERLGSEGWQLVTAIPADEGTSMVFQRPLGRWETGRMSPSFDTVQPDPSVREFSRNLEIPLAAIVEALARLGHPKAVDEHLDDVEVQLLARTFDRVVVIGRSDDPPPEPR